MIGIGKLGSFTSRHPARLTLLLLACAGLAPAQAAPAAGNIPVTGIVGSKCTTGAPWVLTTVVDKKGELDPTLSQRSFVSNGWACNVPSKIALSAQALRLQQPRTSLKNNESQTANFTVRATGWSSAAASVTTAESSALGSLVSYTGSPQTQPNPKSGSITLSVDSFSIVGTRGNSANASKLLEGNYAATITITLSANM